MGLNAVLHLEEINIYKYKTKTMKNKNLKLWLLAALAAPVLFMTSCKKDNDDENEEELITTVILSFVERGTTTVRTATWRDLDGDGGAAPTIETIALQNGKIYDVGIGLLNEQETPPENITDEVRDEDDEHQFYYLPSGVSVVVNGLDTDANGWPLGLTSVWTTNATGTGTMRVVLKHKPDGQKGPNDPIGVGDTDIDINFPVQITP